MSAECVALDGQCGACVESNDAVLCSCITVVGPQDGIGTQFDIAITEDIDAESGAEVCYGSEGVEGGTG
ncbi:MAG: hypothetical protein ACKPHU_34600, partial [Planctomycetaceae bacterium]